MKIRVTIDTRNARDLANMMSNVLRAEATTYEATTEYTKCRGRSVPADGYMIMDTELMGERLSLLTAGALGLYEIPFEVID